MPWQSGSVFERWREFQEKIVQYEYSRALFEYMSSHSPEEIQITENALQIDPVLDFWVHAVEVSPRDDTEFPLVILSYLNGIGTTQRTLLFTWRDAQWQAQELPPVDLEQVQAAHYVANRAAPELLIIIETCAFCSATGIRFALWRWADHGWVQVWQMPLNAPDGLHGKVILKDPTLKTIQRRYSSWNRLDSENIFPESNPGPHRYFIETWVREGDGYTLSGTTTEPSAYNTLVEFSRAMNDHDWNAALRWVTEPSLVQTARTLRYANIGGLAYPPENYYFPAHDSCSIWTIEQCDVWRVYSYQQGKASQGFTIHLARRGAQWLIDSVQRATPPTPKPTRIPKARRTLKPTPHFTPAATPSPSDS